MEHKKILKLTQCALIAALAYVGFQFLRIDIPVGTERTAIHLGNTFVVIGALLLGSWGGFAGARGLTMADLTSGYITSAPKTFLLNPYRERARHQSPDQDRPLCFRGFPRLQRVP